MENLTDYSLVAQTGSILEHVIYIFFSLAGAFFAYWRKSLRPSAALGAFLLAVALYLAGGPLFFILLMVFFLSSTFLSHFKAGLKDPIAARIHAKSGPRDIVQVVANGGAALIMAVPFAISQNPAYLVAVAASFAACNADTWASEIGILSRRAPVSLITLKPVNQGLSGGVSPLGLLASLGGSAVVALTYGLFQLMAGNSGELLWMQMGIITLGGLLGSILDSLMGAAIQAKYISRETGELTEKSSYNNKPNQLHSGLSFVNNDFVNFASSLLAAVLVFIFIDFQ
ncbi:MULTISPECIES: DUF92 domain-containing protein [unclassified Acetobacterium]|jgi:uncharacterized protein (TIGR00297 family)|uniref:DUF92 domain-containing protein n=1 Tax=unclassified Acetobacterium TaxID=2638182 RepID=UPI000DBEBD67|nr:MULTISPECIES: DUF92 domain-containing protein [unclassified Acetobacterium]AWW27181.1 hypothetical protein DOZ58_11390 [Acetobacterium sp. KB-1]MDZ5724384.1 DUF92 domain-containing protein [Acetobacterium sp. K1/6]